ncbi:MAG: glycosyltransferase family 2 protein [Flavobacteriales bacterium]
MKLPLVSIVIPTYNQRPEFLRASVESALAQTYANLEIVISDNHSTNETPSVLKEYETDTRIKIVRPPQHLGLTDNFIFAAANVSGGFISFLSSDDFIFPGCIEKGMEYHLNHPGISFTYCNTAMIDDKGDTLSVIRSTDVHSGIYEKTNIARRMYNHSEYWIIGGIIKTDYFNKVSFVKDVIAADWVLGFQLLAFGKVGYCNEVLAGVRVHERLGAAKEEYKQAAVAHDLQRVRKHNYIVEDSVLLNQIGISKWQAQKYRNHEVSIAMVTLVRKYHAKLVSRDTMEQIINEYNKTQSGFNYAVLSRYYKRKAVLIYTYFIGFKNRISRYFKK